MKYVELFEIERVVSLCRFHYWECKLRIEGRNVQLIFIHAMWNNIAQ